MLLTLTRFLCWCRLLCTTRWSTVAQTMQLGCRNSPFDRNSGHEICFELRYSGQSDPTGSGNTPTSISAGRGRNTASIRQDETASQPIYLDLTSWSCSLCVDCRWQRFDDTSGMIVLINAHPMPLPSHVVNRGARTGSAIH